MVKRLWLMAIACVALSGVLAYMGAAVDSDYIPEKRLAVKTATEARLIIGERLLGEEYTDISTTLGYKDAKMLSAAPDFPALIVQWLKEAGVEEGDAVAINASGSFPALNIAALAAVKAVGGKPLLISSLGASSWGANRIDYTWLHMENKLVEHWGEFRSLGVSLGGDGDRGEKLPPHGLIALEKVIKESGVPQLTPVQPNDAVKMRIDIWKKANGGTLPKAIINVGGNLAYWGTVYRDVIPETGLTMPTPNAKMAGNGVGDEFLKEGRPMIHMLGIKKLAVKYMITDPPSAKSPLWRISRPAIALRIFSLTLCLVAVVLLVKGAVRKNR